MIKKINELKFDETFEIYLANGDMDYRRDLYGEYWTIVSKMNRKGKMKCSTCKQKNNNPFKVLKEIETTENTITIDPNLKRFCYCNDDVYLCQTDKGEYWLFEKDQPVKIGSTRKSKWVYNDGGRKEAGFKGDAGDCVVRSIAIVSGLPYQKVYDDLKFANIQYAETKRTKVAKAIKKQGTTARNGVYKQVYRPYLESLGFKFVSTMGIGTGCKVHLSSEELPKGKIIARVSKHLCAVIDGVIQDTYDCSRNGTRCVYGYFVKVS